MRGVYSNHKKGRDGMTAESKLAMARIWRLHIDLAIKSYVAGDEEEGDKVMEKLRKHDEEELMKKQEKTETQGTPNQE